MNIKINRVFDKSSISVTMINNQGFDMNYPLGFMSPSGHIRFQTTEKSSDGTPRYSFRSESTSMSIGLFGKEYSKENYSFVDFKDWTPICTEKEMLLAMEIQKIADKAL